MKVLVTGGAGHIGKATTERLVRNGWQVRAIGVETGVELPGAEFVNCDILNYAHVRELMRGCQAVIHLAAIRGPQLAAGHRLFQINVAGTFNVFEAAAAEGIRRVVQASSINAMGCTYNLTDLLPEYLPIDENHRIFNTDPYSYSKEIIEDMGRYYWRRDGISSVAIRFPGVYSENHLQSEGFREHRQKSWTVLDSLTALSDADRKSRLDEVRRRVLEWRKQRPMEFSDAKPQLDPVPYKDDPLFEIFALDRFNLWAFLDVRDAAQVLEKSVTAAYDGAHVLFVNDHDNWLSYDSLRLAQFFFPEVTGSKLNLSGSASLISAEKARGLVGFEPEYSVAALARP